MSICNHESETLIIKTIEKQFVYVLPFRHWRVPIHGGAPKACFYVPCSRDVFDGFGALIVRIWNAVGVGSPFGFSYLNSSFFIVGLACMTFIFIGWE